MTTKPLTHGVRQRAWTIMRALQEQGRRFTATDVAQELRVPVPRVASLARTGLMRGFVVALPDQSVALGDMAGAAGGGFAIMPLSLSATAPMRAPRPELSQRGRGGGRTSETQRAWSEIRVARGLFTSRSVADACDVPRQIVEALLLVLLTAGYVSIVTERSGNRGRVYHTIERGGVKPPVRDANGAIRDPNDGRRWSAAGEILPAGEPDPLPGCDRAWLAMRAIRGTFTTQDVAALAEVSPRAVFDLVEMLRRINYVVLVAQGRGSLPNSYRLVVRSGPRSPQRFYAGGWVDPNDGRRWDDAGVELVPLKRRRRS